MTLPQYNGEPVVLIHFGRPRTPWLSLCTGTEYVTPRVGGFSGEYPQVTCPLCQYFVLQGASVAG
jgi:hypothetical protein